MTELKAIVAKNIATLRVAARLTQFELGEKLSYSDKAVSRWERGEAIPDAYVLLQMAEIFGVTVDFILKAHTESELTDRPDTAKQPESNVSKGTQKLATWLSFLGVWGLALLAFVITSLTGHYFWLSFVYAIPISFLVLFILNCVWGRRPLSAAYLSVMVWGVLASIHLTVLPHLNAWMLYLIGIPAQIIIPLAFCFARKR